jgi:4a-hydroxytetrahydrobiopterin dehydratase
MDMLSGKQITAANLTDWRKLGQRLHARFIAGDVRASVRFLTAITEAGEAAGHLEARLGRGHVDVKLISDDAIYRDDAGVEHQLAWVTQQDVDLARRISEIAAEQSVSADPGSITTIELALDTPNAAALAPVWSALLTGGTEARGRGTDSDDVRDATNRVPILWFQETDPHPVPRQRFHIDVQVPYDVAEQRIAAAVAAGAVIVDDTRAPSTTVLADPDGNKACVGTFQPAAESASTSVDQPGPAPGPSVTGGLHHALEPVGTSRISGVGAGAEGLVLRAPIAGPANPPADHGGRAVVRSFLASTQAIQEPPQGTNVDHWCTTGQPYYPQKSPAAPKLGASQGGQGGVEPASPWCCGPANSVTAALSPGNADLQRSPLLTVAPGCGVRVHHGGARMILVRSSSFVSGKIVRPWSHRPGRVNAA